MEKDTPELQSQRTHWGTVIIVALLLMSGLYVFQSLRTIPGDTVDKGMEIASKVIDKSANALARVIHEIKSGTTITEFRNNSLSIAASHKLQVAHLQATENFSKRDFPAYLPDIEVDITVPVEYTYTVDLQGEWDIEFDSTIQGLSLRVIAPKVHFNTPAPDISKMQKRIIKSSVLRDEERLLDELKNEVSLKLKVRALDNIPIIKEIARKSVAQFFREWFFQSYPGLDTQSVQIDIQFQDEVKAQALVPQPKQ